MNIFLDILKRYKGIPMKDRRFLDQLFDSLALKTDIKPSGNNTEVQYNDSNAFGASSDFTWDDSNKALDINGSITGNTLSLEEGVSQSEGIKHQRVTTGSVTVGATALVTVTWTTPFVDANYTPIVSVLESTASDASIKIVHIESKTASAITVRVINDSAGTLTGTIHAIAMHD